MTVEAPLSRAKDGQETFFDLYFNYVGTTESPALFHRWTAMSIIGAIVGRSVFFPFGHSNIYPNQYILLTGTPASRKGTAIKIGKNILEKVGYEHTAPNRAAKEAFWGWMANKYKKSEGPADGQDSLDYLFALDDPSDRITEAYVAHDEFLDFIGSGDKDFVTNLTNLWDNLPRYHNPKTRGEDVYIPNPTVNILSGITPSGIADSFSSLALGGGFFSRMLFVYAEPSGVRITFPSRPHTKYEALLLDRLLQMKSLEGELELKPDVAALIDDIYKSSPGIPDPRFQYYTERRLTHLIKIIIILSVAKISLVPSVEDVILANTILYNTELNMSKALGEYGKSKFSDVANAILASLNNKGPMSIRQLFKDVGRDLNRFQDLMEIMGSLVQQERILKVQGGNANKDILYIPNNIVTHAWKEGLIDFSLLRDDEHKQ